MSDVRKVGAEGFADLVTNAETPVLVDFFATWCGPCKMMAPVLDAMAEKHPDDVQIVKVDVGEEPALAAQFGIQAVPTLLMFNNGEVVDARQGLVGPPELEKMIEEATNPAGN